MSRHPWSAPSVLCLIAAALLPACAGAADVGRSAALTPAVDPAYRIGVGDLLSIRRADGSETFSARVGVDGSLRIPSSGSVRIDGLTAADASQTLAKVLGPDFSNCELLVRDCRSQVVHVFGMDAGEGSRPVPYRGRETIHDFLDRIECRRCQRGYRVRVVRPADSLDRQPQVFAVQLSDRLTSRHPQEKPVRLKPGDYIYIERDLGKPGLLTSLTAGRLYLKSLAR